jgi:SAM-dependent methyltransferase
MKIGKAVVKMNEPYYMAYEKRYQAVFSAGAKRWGHSPDDKVLYNTLKLWVEENNLQGKNVVEYACGEGACGVILSELGCVYHGVDISPSAIEKSRELLKNYPNATVEVLDMVKQRVNGIFDAALDCMGFHMLVTDSDRELYLKNVYHSLKENAPMLFFRESYRMDKTYQGVVDTVDEWAKITGEDYHTPQLRQIRSDDDGNIKEVLIPLLPARAKNEDQYIAEFEEAGFIVNRFVEMSTSSAIPHSATIYVRKKKITL